MATFSREEFLELAKADPWAARNHLTEAYHAHKSDGDARKEILVAAIEVMKNKDVPHGHPVVEIVREDVAHFCFNNVSRSIRLEDDKGARFWISMVQKVTAENAELNRRYRLYLLARFQKLFKTVPEAAKHVSTRELIYMCDGDPKAEREVFRVTRSVMLKEPATPPYRAARVVMRYEP